MTSAILAAELFGLVVVLVVLYANIFESKQKGATRSVFTIFCILAAISILSDAITWYMEINSIINGLIYALTNITFFITFLLFSVFMLYIYYVISEKTTVSFQPYRVGIIINLVVSVVILLLGSFGFFFTYENGMYEDGELYFLYLSLHVAMFVYLFIVSALSFPKIGLHDSVVLTLYHAIILIFFIVSFINPVLNFSYCGVALQVLVIYVMLQSKHQNVLIQQEKTTSLKAHSDELTGLQNRLAFSEAMDEMKKKELLGVLFCDVNGLKYTNDQFGHVEGDNLLKSFADDLLSCFERDSVFRISGDEFIVFLTDVDEGEFEGKVYALRKQLSSHPICPAAVGKAYGNAKEVKNLLDRAETEMYRDKQFFYLKYPELKR